MRLFLKITLVVTVLLSVVLSVCGYMMIERNFSDSLELAIRQTVEQQRRDVNYIREFLFSNEAFRSNPDGTFTYNMMILQMEQSGSQLAVYSGDKENFLSSLPAEITEEEQTRMLRKREEGYSFRRYGNTEKILFTASLDIPNRDIWVLTAYDISGVFLSREAQLQNLLQISLFALGSGVFIALGFSFLLTMPINKLKTVSMRIAGGDYTRRTRIKSLDETGDLSRNFDSMADTIEERMERLRDNIERQNEFVAAFTHEMKTPMTSIVGYSAMLRSRERDEETCQEYLDYIHSEAKRLELLSQKLLRLMGLRGEDIEMLPVALGDIFERAERSLLPEAGGRSLSFEDSREIVLADDDLVEDLLRNLTLNAVGATGEDGEIVVGCEEAGERVRVFVRDDGIGIPKEKIKRITEAFYMVDKSRSRSRGGSGVGLALCERIAALHGDTLHIESREGVGTTVSFTLTRVIEEGKNA